MKKAAMFLSSPIFKAIKKAYLLSVVLQISLITLQGQSLWSDPATWGGSKPVAGDDVTITAGMHVVLDEDTPSLGSLTIEGRLDFNHQNLNLTSEWILIMGQLNVGSANTPYSHQAVFTLTGTDEQELIMGNEATRGIMVMGGTLELHGNPPLVPWTKINAHASTGSTSLSVLQSSGWQSGDQIVIAPTDYYEAGLTNNSISQRATITSLNGNSISINQGLNAFRWGLLQYATSSGMSLSPSNSVSPPAASGFTPTILDQRAPVGNLSRNIVIQAPDDDAWNNDGFGAHVMIMRNMMGNIGTAHVNGVEFRRGGQRGRLGRYPFHWHMISYSGTQELGDGTGQYVRNSTVNSSQHRGIVIHGTNGVEVSNNVVFDVKGHAIFTEDGSERRNLIDGNLILHVRNHDDPADALKSHEAGPSNLSRGSSGFWISNPDNTITNNTAADCTKNGFWLPYGPWPVGLSQHIDMIPQRLQFGVFDNNTAHSNGLEGIRRDDAETTESGSFGASGRYISTSTGENIQGQNHIRERFTLSRYKVWKNGYRGIWDRSDWADNYEVVSADNQSIYFAGAGFDGIIERCLVVGTSLNHMMNGTGRTESGSNFAIPAAFATYHSTFSIKDNIIIGFPAVAGYNSGVFATDDYYLRPVDKGQELNTNNIIIDSHMGVKMVHSYPYIVLAGALWDPHGMWSATPGKYLVYNTPFYTYGQTAEVISPNAATTGGVAVDGPFFGFNNFAINQPANIYHDYMELQVDRLNTSFNTVGSWHVPEAVPGSPLAQNRHFAAHPSSYYRISFPSLAEDVGDIAITVSNIHSEDDKLVLAIPYSNNFDIGQVFTTSVFHTFLNDDLATSGSTNTKHNYTPVASRQMVADSDGETYWYDEVNELVWVKVQGGLEGNWADIDNTQNRDATVYRIFYLRVYGTPASALPVELINFQAQLNDNKEVVLNWSTATENSNDFFSIERSSNGINWEEIQQIPSKGQSETNQYYTTVDTKPIVGKSYYRLKQTDTDGAYTYSKIEIIQLEKPILVNIHPNPFKGVFHLSLPNNKETVEVDIINTKGQIVYTKQLGSITEFDIDLGFSLPGLYVLKVKTQKASKTLKLVQY